MKMDSHNTRATGLDRRQFVRTGAGMMAMSAAGTAIPFRAMAMDGFIALVHTQAAGDSGPIDSMIARLNQISEENGVEKRAVYAQDAATFETVFRTIGDAGAGIIVATFPVISESVKAISPEYPDIKWIHLFGDPVDPPIPNLVTISYDYYLGCYLSGVFAANVTQSGKIGYIGGVSIPPLNADYNALKAGVHSVNPDITVTAAFAGSFQDPAKGYEIASQMFLDGIDYIQTDAAATDGGIIQSANESAGRMVSALSPAQYELGPGSVISIVNLDFGQSLYNEVGNALGSGWAGGSHVATGIGSGVIEFELSPLFMEQGPADLVNLSGDAWQEVQVARTGVIDGSIEVPFNTSI